jgi:hypothetical protein
MTGCPLPDPSIPDDQQMIIGNPEACPDLFAFDAAGTGAEEVAKRLHPV